LSVFPSIFASSIFCWYLATSFLYSFILLFISSWAVLVLVYDLNTCSTSIYPTVAANEKLQAAGMIGAYDLQQDYPELNNTLLFCATEVLSKDDMDRVVEVVK